MTDPVVMTAFLPPLLDFTLVNGLRVILAEDHSAPLVATNVLYRVGAANDPLGRSGFAHLLEHLMSTAFTHVKAGEFDRLLEAAGAENNACTTLDYTAYQIMAPANQLPLLLWLESERMGFPRITRSAFKAQRRVVIEELKETVTNSWTNTFNITSTGSLYFAYNSSTDWVYSYRMLNLLVHER